MSIERLLDSMHNVKAVGPQKWSAGCPCCQSKKGRPVAIRALDDGRILLHGFCGCGTDDILSALGLTMSDLFPERLPGEFKPVRQPFDARQVLDCIAHEAFVAGLCAEALGQGETLGAERLRLAAARIHDALNLIRRVA